MKHAPPGSVLLDPQMDQHLSLALKPPRPLWQRALPLLVLIAASILVFATGLHKLFSLDVLAQNEASLRETISQNSVLALGLFMLIYAGVVALSLPAGAVLTISGGFLFGLFTSGIAVVISATIGACLLFGIARSAFGTTLAQKAGPTLAKIAQGFQQDAVSYLLFLRFAPIFPFALVNIATALLGIRFRTFVWTTALGILPGTFAFASIGAGLGSVITHQRDAFEACKAAGAADCTLSINPSDLVTREILIAFFLLALVALIPVVAKRVMARRNSAA